MVRPALPRRIPEPVRIPEPIRRPEPPRIQTQPTVRTLAADSRVGERNLQTGIVKTGLNRQLNDPPMANPPVGTQPVGAPTNPAAVNLTPQAAVDRLKTTPTPPLTDPVATRNNLQQRADIADTALRNAVPPTPTNPASLEARDDLNAYHTNIQTLQNISTAAHTALNAPPTDVLNDASGRVWGAGRGGPQAGAQALGQEIQNLNTTYGSQAGGQLVGRLYQDSKDGSYGHNLNNLLTHAGGNEANNLGAIGLPPAQRDVIGTAVGQAYDQMSPADRTGFINGVVEQTRLNGFANYALGGDPARISDLIGRSGNTTLKTDAVNAFTQRMADTEGALFDSNQGVDVRALANGAATIAASGTGPEYTAMFTNIVKNFSEMKPGQFEHLMEDPALKDNLSRAFINNSDAIIRGMTDEAGGLRDAKSSDGLRQFFEMTMFSGDPGQLRQQVMGEAVRVISQYGDPTAAPTAGRTKADDARTAGSLIGLVQAAALNQKDSIEASQESRQETVEMFTGMAFSFAPGASQVLGKGASNLLEAGFEQGKEYAQEQANSGIGNLINELNDGEALENIDNGFKEIRDLSFQVSSTLENNDDLYNAFNSGYSRTGVDQLFAKEFGE